MTACEDQFLKSIVHMLLVFTSVSRGSDCAKTVFDQIVSADFTETIIALVNLPIRPKLLQKVLKAVKNLSDLKINFVLEAKDPKKQMFEHGLIDLYYQCAKENFLQG